MSYSIPIFDSMDYLALKKELSTPRKITVITHFNPDGDAIGSAAALSALLKKNGHEVSCMVPNEFPEFLNWIVDTQAAHVYQNNPTEANQLLDQCELLFCLDFNAMHRADELGAYASTIDATKVMIDHHLQPDDCAQFMLSDTSASSTAELVYQFAVEMGWKDLIDRDIAEAIYVGIMTDTGSFKFPSTTQKTHETIAALMEAGARNSWVHEKVYDQNSQTRILLLGHCLNHMEIIDGKVALFTLSSEIQEKFQVQKGDTEGFVNYGLSIKGVFASVFLREDNDQVKMSFRSQGDLDMNTFARRYFNGGGHKNAAGGISKSSLDETVDDFKKWITSYLSEQ